MRGERSGDRTVHPGPQEATTLLDGVQAILFDLDGTLIMSSNLWAAGLSNKLEPLRKILPRLDTMALSRRLVMAIEMPSNYLVSAVEHLGLSLNPFGLADRLRRSKGLATRESAPLIDGTIPLLEQLCPRFKMAIVTTRARPETQAFIEHASLGCYFETVITRQDVLFMKPHPEPVRKAANQLGVSPANCVMVGDTAMDIRAARRAGAYAVGVLTGLCVREELEQAGAHLILQRAAELLQYLPSVEGA